MPTLKTSQMTTSTTPVAKGTSRKTTRIVVVGGGFAGVFAARELEKRLRRRKDVEILLFSRENYFVFQPMLPEVISGTIGITDVVSPLQRLLACTHVHVRDVESIDVARATTTAAPGSRPLAHSITYDHLVLAPGILLSGRAEVVRAGRALACLGPGDSFGEMALLGNAPRNAVVRCVEPMTVLSIPKGEFGLLAANVPGLRSSFEQVMARRGLPAPGQVPTTPTA